jgi:hypothetical protein
MALQVVAWLRLSVTPLTREEAVFNTPLLRKKGHYFGYLLMRFDINRFVSQRSMPMESYLIIILMKLIFPVVLLFFVM